MKKVLFTVQSYYPSISGVPVVTKYLAEGLSSRGYDVTVVTRKIEGCQVQEVFNNVKIIRFDLNHTPLHRIIGKDRQNYIDYIRKADYDVIIVECCNCETTNLVEPLLKDINSKKIFHTHGAGMYSFKFMEKRDSLKNTLGYSLLYIQKLLYFQRLKKYLNEYDYILALSEAKTALKYIELNADKSRIRILGNAIDDVFWENYKINNIYNYCELESKKYLLSVANYSPYKNQREILREFYKITNTEYSLVFIGSTNNLYYKSLIELYNKNKRKFPNHKVFFLYNVNRKDIPGIVNGAYLYLVGSTYEEFSISIAEAMSQGVPFISTNVGNALYLPGGLTINKVSELHIACNKLLSNKDEYNKLAKKALKFSKENFKQSLKVNQLENLINE